LFPNEFKTYFKFAFVRNPWDRLVSAFFHFREERGSEYETIVSKKYLKRYGDFFVFCKDFVNEEGINKIIHLRPQYDYITNEKDEIIVDFVGRFENIQEDFAFVCNRIGASCNLSYKRKSKHWHYSSYYNAETTKIVGRVYQKDIELFDYAFEFGKLRDVHYYLNYFPDEIKKGLKVVRNLIAGSNWTG
jgi:hypothetical protein